MASARQSLTPRKTPPRLLACLSVLPLLCATSCGTRAIYLKPGDPVQVRETIRKAPVWVFDKTGQKIPTTVDLPIGKYVIDDPGPESK